MTARTLTLAEFLLERIAEDKADGERDWGPNEPGSWLAWLLAECEAKRKIVERCQQVLDGRRWMEMSDDAADQFLRILAQPYADHDGFREEWRA